MDYQYPFYTDIPGPTPDFEHGINPGRTWVHTPFTQRKNLSYCWVDSQCKKFQFRLPYDPGTDQSSTLVDTSIELLDQLTWVIFFLHPSKPRPDLGPPGNDPGYFLPVIGM